MERVIEALIKALIRALKTALALTFLSGCVTRGTLEREVRLSFERGAESRQGEIDESSLAVAAARFMLSEKEKEIEDLKSQARVDAFVSSVVEYSCGMPEQKSPMGN